MVPEPKPIRTVETMHSLCVTKGPLATYKLHIQTYGGKSDENLSRECSHTNLVQKWVHLLDEVLEKYKYKGHNVTTDSAYMGEIMEQISGYEWKTNMVGTAQANRRGEVIDDVKTYMVIGRYDCALFQHRTMPICFAMWDDNNIVKTLSNYHSSKILSS